MTKKALVEKLSTDTIDTVYQFAKISEVGLFSMASKTLYSKAQETTTYKFYKSLLTINDNKSLAKALLIGDKKYSDFMINLVNLDTDVFSYKQAKQVHMLLDKTASEMRSQLTEFMKKKQN